MVLGQAVIERDEALSGASAAVIAEQLREAIIEGRYASGQRLPPERHLASQFGASRSTVREALRRLNEQQLVDRRIGSGTFVTYRGSGADDEIAASTSPLQLIEVRMAIEPQMARLAVLHATGRDLDRLEAALKAVEEAGTDPERYSAADEEFHLALATCTGNPLMIGLYEQINEVRLHAQWAAMRSKVLTAENVAIYNAQHAAVVAAVRRRDVEAAAAAMREQMEKARADLVGVHSR